MLDDRRGGSQRGLLGSLYAGIVIDLGSILRWTILRLDFLPMTVTMEEW